MDQEFLNELALVYYISYDFPQLQYSEKDFFVLNQRKNDWKSFSETEKKIYLDKVKEWCDHYNSAYPNQLQYVVKGWKKINWSNDDVI